MKNDKLNITPGKWEVTGTLDALRIEKRRPDGSWALIAEVHTEDHNVPRYEEAEANAKLISMAPKMLKALKSVSKYLYYKEENNGHGLGDFPHPKNAINDILNELKNINC